MNADIVGKTLADQAEERIILYIKENGYVPGDTLPSEMHFSEMMGISRNVVREAMSRLRMLGLIQSRTKRGMVLAEPPLLNGFEKILDPQLFSIQTIKDMMGMRLALEFGIVDFIFNNITENDVEELTNIVTRHEALGINYLSVEDELSFHLRIYKIAGNQFILNYLKLMHPVFVFAKKNYESYFQPVTNKLLKENKIITHNDILDLLKSRDIDGYRKAISMHLRPYWEFLYNYQH